MPTASTHPLHFESLLAVSARIAGGELSPVALVEHMLARIAAVDPGLHAYLRVTGESALAEAEVAEREIRSGRHRGALHGVPIALKDLFHTRGVPSTFGSPVYRDFVAEDDATLVHRLRMAGVVILGRLHLHEGAFGGHHPDLPRCLNPWNSAYWPGGSSSGSGAATAAGLCFASLGTDTGGSIRFPSAANGLTGLKVTWGRTSRYGVFPLADSLDTIGPMARSAADAAVLFDIMAGEDPLDPTTLPGPTPNSLNGLDGALGARELRIGIDAGYVTTGTDRETASALQDALTVFRDLGAVPVAVTVPDRAAAVRAQIVITDAECARFHNGAFAKDPSRFGPELAGAIRRGLGYQSTVLTEAYITRDRFKGELARLFRGIDVLVSPVLPEPGILYDDMDRHLADLPAFLGYTGPFNLSGSPTLTFPCGMAAIGLPLGIQLIGPHLSEPSLLRAVHAFQQVTDWHLRRPPGF